MDGSWSNRELRTECVSRGIRNFTRLSKDNLIRLLNNGGLWVEMQMGPPISLSPCYLSRTIRDRCLALGVVRLVHLHQPWGVALGFVRLVRWHHPWGKSGLF